MIQEVDKTPLMSNEQTVSHMADKFILDFKGVYTQYLPENQPVVVVNHKTILLDPFFAKGFLKALKTNIERYEEKYGEIKKSNALKKAEKEVKEMKIQADSTGVEKPDYTG